MTQMQLSLGTRLTSPDERLTTITLHDLHDRIINAEPQLLQQVAILHSVLNIDSRKYHELKKALPYFVCGKFATGHRLTDDFSSTSSFVIDIDHYDKPLGELKDRIAADKRVALLYTSPSGTGLKALFTLSAPCTDANVYVSFYRRFAFEWAHQHGISQWVDLKTHDVTRACFICPDADCRFNPDAQPVAVADYVDLDSVDIFMSDDKAAAASCAGMTPRPDAEEAKKDIDPDSETMARIKAVLDTNRRKRAEAETGMETVPEQIRTVVEGLKTSVDELGINLYETRGIQYGVKLKFRSTLQEAEVNMFYGRRGYSVVMSPRRGTSAQFGSMMTEFVKDYVYTLTA